MASPKRYRINPHLPWFERMLYHRYSKRFWLVSVLGCLLCVLLYQRCVNPVMYRWKGMYGEVNVPDNYGIHGIDVSHHQQRIDWDKLSATTIQDRPISFAIIKATEGGSHKDRLFDYNFARAEEVGMIRGAYHYFKPNISGKKQAQFFLRVAPLEEGDLPPVVDVEEIGQLSVAQLQAELKSCLDILEERYYAKPIIYTGLKFKQRYLNSKTFDKYPLWLAHYYVKEMKYQGKWRFWQHTDRGRLPGIRGKVDLNVYNGSMYDLKQLTIKY